MLIGRFAGHFRGRRVGYFDGEIAFVRNVIRYFHVAVNNTRVAAVTFASSTTVSFDFWGDLGSETWFDYYAFGQPEVSCGGVRAVAVAVPRLRLRLWLWLRLC